MQQQLAVPGAPSDGVAFCAAPIAVPIVIGRKRGVNDPASARCTRPARPRWVVHATVSGFRVGLPMGALSVRKSVPGAQSLS